MINKIDKLFEKLADFLIWLIILAFIAGCIYIGFRAKIYINKQSIKEYYQENQKP